MKKVDITRWCYILNIKALGIVVSDKKMFSYFPYTSLCKTCDPRTGHFGPRDIMKTNLVKAN